MATCPRLGYILISSHVGINNNVIMKLALSHVVSERALILSFAFDYISEDYVSHINGVRPGFLGLQLD